MKESLEEETVFYNGMNIPKSQFRTYIFGFDGEKKLVNSYAEFEKDIASGVWFESLEILEARKAAKKSTKSTEKIKGA